MDYIDQRLRPRIVWYDRRASAAKRLRMAVDVASIVMGMLLVLLIPEEGFSRLGLAVMAASISTMLAIEKVAAFGERWILYRLAAESLQGEIELYTYRAGPYRNEVDADRLLVERAEALLEREASKWHSIRPVSELTLEKKLSG